MYFGSIPAQAGEPPATSAGYREVGLSPRRRGNRRADIGLLHKRGLSPRRRGNRVVPLTSGLSPRRRGNHGEASFQILQFGSIPAQAGEPWRLILRLDDPRSAFHDGSIPAQAGEPSSAASSRLATRVYPRAGGGTTHSPGWAPPQRGLSPRRRGNLVAWRLYPPDLGLSPRRRGNPRYHSDAEAQSGSIPAQAGEPSLNPVPPYPSRVYPRAGGGTAPPLPLTG